MALGRILQTLLNTLELSVRTTLGTYTQIGPPDGATIGMTSVEIIAPDEDDVRFIVLGTTSVTSVFYSVGSPAEVDKGGIVHRDESAPIILAAGASLNVIGMAGSNKVMWQIYQQPEE